MSDLSSTSCTVLLATYNGVRFLDEQLASIASQGVAAAIDIIASDDGSTDGTLDLLEAAAGRWTRGRFTVREGPRCGFQENFRALLLSPGLDAGFVAFSDQDDIWETDKLARAAAALGPPDAAQPRLFCSATRTMSADGVTAGTSPIFRRPPSFENALVQSLAGANTMVLNRAAARVLAESVRRTGFVSHDWWAYLMVTGAGGAVTYSPEPTIRYRQHDGNLVGENASWAARLQRLRMLREGRFRSWTDQNLAGLSVCADLLTDEARERISDLEAARRGGLMARLGALRRASVYRQTRLGQFGLYLACALGKL